MKKIAALIIIAAFFAASCKQEMVETNFYFAEAQPINDTELDKLPDRYIGTYIGNEEDTLVIDAKAMYNKFGYVTGISKDSLKAAAGEGEYLGNALRIDGGKDNYIVKEDKDSVYLHTTYRDTLFAFSDAAKAKRINGQVVLSRKDSIYWKVSLLSLEKDSLSLRRLTQKTDYASLQAVVKNITVNGDTTVVQLKPTRKEFKKILKVKLGAERKYKKIG